MIESGVHLHRTAFPGTARQGKCGAVQVSRPKVNKVIHIIESFRLMCGLDTSFVSLTTTRPPSWYDDVPHLADNTHLLASFRFPLQAMSSQMRMINFLL